MKRTPVIRALLLATALSYAAIPAAYATAETAAPVAKPAAKPAPKATVKAAAKAQVAGYHRFQLGDFVVTALYDGPFSLDKKLLHASDEEKDALLALSFVDASQGIQTAVNGYLVDTGKKLVLVDTGAAKKFGAALGNIADNIKAAGYDAKNIKAVLLTHLHPDHASGLLTAEGAVLFPNATVYASQEESDYWLDDKNADIAPEGKKGMFALAQEAVAPYKAAGKFKTFHGDETLFDGIIAASSAGHTPGHTGYHFASGGQDLLIWGDIIHSHAVQFAKPEISVEFDSDPVAAVATRQRVLADTASRKLWVAGAHLPFPGIGHVRKEENGSYRWVPLEYGVTN